tara:strand:+ start:1040 stop:1375 length:336 start_codon:yes stop_codon:yes gene_type:complete
MAETYKVNNGPVASTATVVYTCPAPTEVTTSAALVRSIYIGNTETDTDHTVTIEVVHGGTTSVIVKGVLVPMQSSLQPLSGAVVLNQGDTIKIHADEADKLDYTISCLEIT